MLSRDKKFSLQKVKLNVAIQECARQIVTCFPTKILNPLYMLGLISMEPNITPYCRRVANNCKLLRSHVMNYVRDRKSGKRQSKAVNKSDILSAFLE